ALIWIDATLTPLPTAPQATAPHMTWAWWREQLIAAWFVLSVVGIVARAVQGFSLGEYFAVVIIINVALAAARLISTAIARGAASELTIVREAPLAFSLGHVGDVEYAWHNPSHRRARLRV